MTCPACETRHREATCPDCDHETRMTIQRARAATWKPRTRKEAKAP